MHSATATQTEAIICDHCDSTEGPFRETFHGSTICVDSEKCAARWMRRFWAKP